MNTTLLLIRRKLVKSTLWLLSSAVVVACGGGGQTTPATLNTETAEPKPVPAPTPAQLSSVSFQATQALLDNPERGFYSYASDLSVISDSFLMQTASKGHRLIYTPNDLSAWRDTALPQSYLDGLNAGFAKVRKAGLKIVLRFAYNYPSNETDYLNAKDASLSQIQSHLAQLAPVISSNQDVIAIWQAGFIGAWGEWHTSSNGLTSAANKLQVRDALLAVLPNDRTLQVRYPGDLLAWFPTPPSPAELQQSILPVRARIGMHNDCFLASHDDVGTYFPSAQSSQLRAHVQSTSNVAAFGGETCLPPVLNQARMSCSDILAEGTSYGLSYLNRDYHLPFFNKWAAEGCMDEVTRKIGYRIELQNLEHSTSVARGSAISFALTLRNTGWARLMNDRPLVIRIETAQGQVVHTETVSARTLRMLGAGQSQRVQMNGVVPSSVAAGRYRLTVAAPDAATTLAANPIYAIRFANADQGTEQYWDVARAVMVTGAWVDVR
ncbi:DUF4832 domain-containing protein [Variovorax sp. PCZ-1]|uniref:DUF4832 domain-containing protein n=1 Tax=Variovorax sp. PCZ-1 TaxID=2835533 RepID=UPI001BD1B097|nr:DUF4832 domain-containing protein [Variovorax sp. PCZ-1]MBS7808481.1 DUF4832 domain-containing protein [Variovorax sp. PCZ-1]